jgi:hippurate hydrolase
MIRRRSYFWCLLFACGLVTWSYAQDSQQWVDGNLAPLLEVYVHLHQNPELSFQEKETAEYVAQQLEAVGCEVTRNVGGFGVVGLLSNGEGKTVMVRSDLDALPITEQTDLPYASKKSVVDAEGKQVGVMHACGHDVHMTNMIGVARFLAEHQDAWKGRVIFIGQPAEERGSGAIAMLKDGLFDRFGKPDYALALHCSSTLGSGSVGVRAGFAMANVDSVDIEIVGRGGHGAYPHTTVDPIVIAAKLIVDLQTIVSREMKPIDPTVITVGAIHAGTKHNITPDRCHLQLTVRTYRDDVRERVLASIQRKAEAAAMSAGADKPEIKVSEGTPALENDPKLAARVREILVDSFGAEKVREPEQVMGGEDFGQFGRHGVPSVVFELGAIDPRQLEYYVQQKLTPPSLHTATFAPDLEATLETAIVAMSNCVLELLKPE